MRYIYISLVLVFMLLPIGVWGYHVDYDSFPSFTGSIAGTSYILNSELNDIEGGGMTDGMYHLISSAMLQEIALPIDNLDLTSQVFTSELLPNYPNPFNPSTTIHFSLQTASQVTINIYNLKGQLVKTLTDAHYQPGHHNLQWTGSDTGGRNCPSGLYTVCMKVGRKNHLRKVVLLK